MFYKPTRIVSFRITDEYRTEGVWGHSVVYADVAIEYKSWLFGKSYVKLHSIKKCYDKFYWVDTEDGEVMDFRMQEKLDARYEQLLWRSFDDDNHS